MLHLQTSVHLEEIKVLVLIHEELNRSRSVVIATTGKSDSLLSHFLACLGIHDGTRCFFNDFLISALNGALTLWHVNIVAMQISKNLELNVSRGLDVLFDENSSVTE